jgi:hypothetical protein
VADIENANASAHGHVLSNQAGVLDRHVPSAKIDHLGAHLAMNAVQGSLTQSGIYVGGWTQECFLCSGGRQRSERTHNL